MNPVELKKFCIEEDVYWEGFFFEQIGNHPCMKQQHIKHKENILCYVLKHNIGVVLCHMQTWVSNIEIIILHNKRLDGVRRETEIT